MRLLNFTIIKLCLCLITGIILAQYLPISITLSFSISLIVLAFLCFSLIISRKQIRKTVWFGVLAYLTTISIGILTTISQDEKQNKRHYSHFITTQPDASYQIQFTVNESLKPSLYYYRYIISIITLNDNRVSGTSLLNIKKDSTDLPLRADVIYAVNTMLTQINTPQNPNQFNYKSYLEKQHIYHQLFVKDNEILQRGREKRSLKGLASTVRHYIQTALKQYNFKPDELSIINAMILGQRQGISKKVYTHYTNAGAIHILAISGLHIGIILMILNVIFKPLEQFRHGKPLKMISIIILLWLYALLAGASASVVRASTMFTIVAIGMHLKRPSNIYNTLAISIFFILLIKPLFLFDIGFQLSYVAVLSIVTIQPLLYSVARFRFWIVDKLWQILTVTLAAQIGVLPISLFYFHQFSGLFWLSNLVIIPLLGLILSGGLIIMILAIFHILPQSLASVFGAIIRSMNLFFEWVSGHDQFLFQGISFNMMHLVLAYIGLIACVQFYLHRKYNTLIITCTCIIGFQLINMYDLYHYRHDALIVFHNNKHTLVALKHYRHLKVYHNTGSLKDNNTIVDFAMANQISEVEEDSLQYLYKFRDKQVLLIDSLGIYQLKSIRPDYIVLCNSPKINLERLIDSIKPYTIIADGSNYRSYVTRWKKTCKKRKLPFHYTNEKGAFILK